MVSWKKRFFLKIVIFLIFEAGRVVVKCWLLLEAAISRKRFKSERKVWKNVEKTGFYVFSSANVCLSKAFIEKIKNENDIRIDSYSQFCVFEK